MNLRPCSLEIFCNDVSVDFIIFDVVEFDNIVKSRNFTNYSKVEIFNDCAKEFGFNFIENMFIIVSQD
jgi:hypothetical protein